MPVDQQSDRLLVHSIWPTIQGEGLFAGQHAIFLRLTGCNLQCPWCDTEYTAHATAYAIREDVEPCLVDLVAAVQKHQPIRNRLTVSQKQLVVITGGEPFRQNLAPLVKALIETGYRVQIETNGTLWQELHPKAVIVCSPKTPKIHPELAMRVNAYKYVLDAGHVNEHDGLPDGTLGKYGHTARPPVGWEGEIFVQPLDESNGQPVLCPDCTTGNGYEVFQANKANLQACVASVLRFGYRLCIQTHKIANVA